MYQRSLRIALTAAVIMASAFSSAAPLAADVAYQSPDQVLTDIIDAPLTPMVRLSPDL